MKVIRLHKDATLPSKKNYTDGGIDLYPLISYQLRPGEGNIIIKTGVSIEIPYGYVGLIRPRGRSSFLVGSGVIDYGYAPGEIMVRVFNPTQDTIRIPKGVAFVQLVVVPVFLDELMEISLEDAKHLPEVEDRQQKGGILDTMAEQLKKNYRT